ncbi:uncharacterized protein BDFB_001382, partial [Asbolus verrucosus]
NENGQPVNLEIDFFSNFETKKFLDDDQNTETEEVFSHKQRDPFEGTKPPGADEAKRRMFLLFINTSNNFTGANNDSTPLDSWSVVWYIASFGGLIIFFLIVSCSEWCCRRAIRNSQGCNRSNNPAASPTAVPDTPPPSYDQFAPPSYESICLGRHERGSEKSEYDIYVVPVHALGTIMETREREDAPPSYFTASSGRNFVPALTRLESNPESRVT